jgi:5-formyltetrahydrofolate cyclo-ligase
MMIPKTDWRRRLAAARWQLDEATRRTYSAAIVARICSLPAFEGSATLLTYHCLGAEVDLSALGEAARDAGKVVYHPATAVGAPRWVREGGAEGGSSGPEARATALERPILVVVPGVGFDERGSRLGRGGGFYDRALAILRVVGEICVLGAAFETQIVARLPVDEWDQGVDLVVTERRLILAESGPGSDGAGRQVRGGGQR